MSDEMIDDKEVQNNIDNGHALIGYGYLNHFQLDLTRIANVVKCASYYDHSLCTDVKGNVYGIGNNEQCELGLGHDKNVSIPELISINANIIEMAVGGHHSILLCDKGFIYTMGSNEHHQCAQGNKYLIKKPTKCIHFESEKCVKISAGQKHSGVITSDNSVCLFGLNKYGQCGVKKEMKRIKSPQKMCLFGRNIACGGYHTLIISANNKIYACGNNYDGQIGNGTRKPQFGLIQVNLPHTVIDAKCGGNHSLCILENGAAYSWGRGASGQLGHGEKNNKLVPTQIKFQNIKFKKCVVGLSNSCLIDVDDNLYCFGYNKEGQLCVGDKENKYIPTKIEKKNVMDISMGYKYSFLLFGRVQRKKQNKDNNIDKVANGDELLKEEEEEKKSEIGRDVKIWLRNDLQLPNEYFAMFMEDGFDDMDVIIQTLTEEDLKAMKYKKTSIKKGHLRKILLSLKGMRQKQNKNEEMEQQIEGANINLNDNVHGANILDTYR